MLCRVVVNPTCSYVDYFFFFLIEHSNKCSTKVSENCQQGTRLILIKAFVRKHFVVLTFWAFYKIEYLEEVIYWSFSSTINVVVSN